MADGDRIPKVLVVDDEDALHQAELYEPDLMVLDVMLPDMDGFEVCRTLRQAGNDVPVIFLTARDTTSDTIRGLTLGGDDYVTKPFSVEALVARVRAVLRRTTRQSGGDGPLGGEAELLTVGDLELDEEHWIVRRGGTAVELSPTEFRLLAYLMRNQGRMLTRQQLLENVWGWEFAGQSQVVETYVSYLRRKLDPLGPPLIHTQRGVGYSLRPPPETERASR
jgi:two-component system OmpR family response regulator